MPNLTHVSVRRNDFVIYSQAFSTCSFLKIKNNLLSNVSYIYKCNSSSIFKHSIFSFPQKYWSDKTNLQAVWTWPCGTGCGSSSFPDVPTWATSPSGSECCPNVSSASSTRKVHTCITTFINILIVKLTGHECPTPTQFAWVEVGVGEWGRRGGGRRLVRRNTTP